MADGDGYVIGDSGVVRALGVMGERVVKDKVLIDENGNDEVKE